MLSEEFSPDHYLVCSIKNIIAFTAAVSNNYELSGNMIPFFPLHMLHNALLNNTVIMLIIIMIIIIL